MAIQFEEALNIIEKTAPLAETERVSIYECAGRVCARDIVSPIDQPPFARSPLDGFAFRSADVKGASAEKPARLRQVGYVPAGCAQSFAVGTGECVRIMTGGAIPADCDAVIGIEDASYEKPSERGDDAVVLVYREIAHHQNYVFAGEDFAKGQLLCRAGQTIDAALAACLAAAGFAQVSVRKKARVAVIATGSEVLPAGEPLTPGKIYDANAVYLVNRLAQLGFCAQAQLAADDQQVLQRLLEGCIGTCELVITTGGVSVGDEDYMPAILKQMGAAIRFHGVAMKPGSPLLLAEKDGTQLLCLSGNPYAAAATFELFARPLLARLCGMDLAMKHARASLAHEFPKGSAVPRFLRASLRDGQLFVPDAHASGQLYSFSGCNCLAKLPAAKGATPAGTQIEVYLI